jgi:hypothetical protein
VTVVDDRVPTAYCPVCQTLLFRRTIEEHECPMGYEQVALEVELNDPRRASDRALLWTAVRRLVLVMVAIGAVAFLLAWWLDSYTPRA